MFRVSRTLTACATSVVVLSSGVVGVAHAQAGGDAPASKQIGIVSENCYYKTDKDGNPLRDENGKLVPVLDENGKQVCEKDEIFKPSQGSADFFDKSWDALTSSNSSKEGSSKDKTTTQGDGSAENEKFPGWAIALTVIGSLLGLGAAAFWLTFEQFNVSFK